MARVFTHNETPEWVLAAEIRLIQEMLGHASLATTQIYTRVAIHKLKAIHDATHPGATLKRHAPREEAPSLAAPPSSKPAEAEELLAALAAEAPEEGEE